MTELTSRRGFVSDSYGTQYSTDLSFQAVPGYSHSDLKNPYAEVPRDTATVPSDQGASMVQKFYDLVYDKHEESPIPDPAFSMATTAYFMGLPAEIGKVKHSLSHLQPQSVIEWFNAICKLFPVPRNTKHFGVPTIVTNTTAMVPVGQFGYGTTNVSTTKYMKAKMIQVSASLQEQLRERSPTVDRMNATLANNLAKRVQVTCYETVFGTLMMDNSAAFLFACGKLLPSVFKDPADIEHALVLQEQSLFPLNKTDTSLVLTKLTHFGSVNSIDIDQFFVPQVVEDSLSTLPGHSVRMSEMNGGKEDRVEVRKSFFGSISILPVSPLGQQNMSEKRADYLSGELIKYHGFAVPIGCQVNAYGIDKAPTLFKPSNLEQFSINTPESVVPPTDNFGDWLDNLDEQSKRDYTDYLLSVL